MSHVPETSPMESDGVPIPADLRELVNTELMDGETIRWIDMPIPYAFTLGSSIAFGFGVYFCIWSIVVICILVSSIQSPHPAPVEFAPIGAIIFLIGIYLLTAPLRVRRRTQRTIYALTNHRAIIVQGTFSAFDVTSYYPANLWHLSRKQKADGTGSLCFNTTGGGVLQWTIRRGFLNVRNVGKVERMMQDLKGTTTPEK